MRPLRRVLAVWLFSLALGVCAVSGCSKDGGGGPGRGVVLIAIDALRADHIGGAGYDRDTTPFLDSLAEQGVAFDQAFTTAPWILPAHVSLLTGCDPQIAMRVLPENVSRSVLTLWNVPEAAPRISKEFLRAGYATAAFVDYPWLGSAQGFTSGFETFKPSDYATQRKDELGIAGVGARLEQWIKNRVPGQDWFAYVHLNDLERVWQTSDPQWDTYFQPRAALDTVPPVGDADHLFFAVPRHRWSGGLHTLGEYEAQYDGAIRRVDTALARIFTRLEQVEAFQDVTVVIVGSHGLGFGEAGLILDHGTLSDVDLHVPLIVRPGRGVEFEAGLRTDALASLMDVGPTLLAMQDLPVPADMQGLPLLEPLRGLESPRTYAFARCAFQEALAVIDERWCFERRYAWISRDPMLSFSWYGSTCDEGDVEEVLHDRANDDSLAHWGSGRPRPVVMDRMRTAGIEWVARVDAARRSMQSERWSAPAARRDTETDPPDADGSAP